MVGFLSLARRVRGLLPMVTLKVGAVFSVCGWLCCVWFCVFSRDVRRVITPRVVATYPHSRHLFNVVGRDY